MWLINKSNSPIQCMMIEYKKWVTFKPMSPIQIHDYKIALKYLDKYNSVQKCDNPDDYFNGDVPFRK